MVVVVGVDIGRVVGTEIGTHVVVVGIEPHVVSALSRPVPYPSHLVDTDLVEKIWTLR